METHPGSEKVEPKRCYTALILAGRRAGADRLAEAAGAPHRALLDVDGVPMLERVVHTLKHVAYIGRIVVSTDAPELLHRFPELARDVADGSIVIMRGEQSASRRVLQVLNEMPADTPLLVTTADHALLTPEMVEYFLTEAEQGASDLAFGLVAASRIRARFPESKRTYIPFRGESYSGANLFAFRTSNAWRGAEFWTRVEESRKKPWRLARAFGPLALLLFMLRLLDLESAMRRASRTIGARIQAVPLPFAEAAVDVDRLGDLILVREILSNKASHHAPQPAGPRLGHVARYAS
ncbi:MAG: NTP transferase domain-containing protein [Gemmatimonadales bacterium]|nr:NTP transferase domain-containing protein [Gemmatimonadales bacterium]